MSLNLTVKETRMQKGTRTLGGGLRPPSEASPQDVVRAAGRRGAGAPPSEASDPEIRAAGRRGAGAPPSEASDPGVGAAGRGGAGAPPAEASDPEIRAAGRRGAGVPPSEASDPEIRAAGRRGRRASRSTAGGWAPRVRGERSGKAPPSEASVQEIAPAEPALEAEHSPGAVFLVAMGRLLSGLLGEEGADGGDDLVHLGVGVPGRHRERQDLLHDAFGALERRRVEVLDRGLLVAGDRVVDAGGDAARLERL